MTSLELPVDLPKRVLQVGVHRFSVSEYHRLRDDGYLEGPTRYELLDGYITPKLIPKPSHASTVSKLYNLLLKLVPRGFMVYSKRPLTLSTSEPIPDLCAVRQTSSDDYDERHPGAADCELVIEVAETTLESDRTDMMKIYARDRIAVYWIVNLIDRAVEVYEVPNGTKAKPRFKTRRDYFEDEEAPVVLGGKKRGGIAVTEILPKVRS
jgi:Uma2 family endonuclease